MTTTLLLRAPTGAALALLLALATPATYAQLPKNPAIECLAEHPTRPALASLVGKVALSADPKVSLEMQAIADKPTAEEKAALSRWSVMRDTCFELGMGWMNAANAPRWLRAVVTQSKDANDSLTSQLYRGDLTYGDFNVRRMALAAEVRKRIDEGEMGSGSSSSSVAVVPAATKTPSLQEDQYRCEQEASRAYPPNMVQRMTSPGVQMPSRPTQTDCTQYGNQISCRSGAGGIDTSIYNRPPTYVTEDSNQGNRNASVRSCMLAKGYSLK
jgi:hypothetical protein